MFLLRIALPDRPGSLGAVATAMGTADADIAAVEIVDKRDGIVVDDFMLSLPSGTPPDVLVTVCAQLPDVQVLWLSHYPESWGLQSDVDVLDEMMADHAHAGTILTGAAPEVFHASWAVLVDRSRKTVLASSDLAPDLNAAAIDKLGDLTQTGARELPAGWHGDLSETVIALAPLDTTTLVVARHGGPDFRPSEQARLRYLAALAH